MKDRTELERQLLNRVNDLAAQVAELVEERNALRTQLDNRDYETEIKSQDYDVIAQCLTDYQTYGWTDRLDVALRMTR